jgi:CRISPR/Cas system-associated endonuclease/helicase Cas3
LILVYPVLIIRGSAYSERTVIFISNLYLTIFSYNYFHIDRGLRRKQHLRYRQRIHEKSYYCVGKKDLSNSFIENINNSIDSIILFNFLDQLLEEQYQLRIMKMKNQVKITTTKNQKKYRQ